MSRIKRPEPRWHLMPVAEAGHPGRRWAAIAPGCGLNPHDDRKCGCRRFDTEADAESYIRNQPQR